MGVGKTQEFFDYKSRFSIFICTAKDIERLKNVNEGRGNIGINMINGKLLYERNFSV